MFIFSKQRPRLAIHWQKSASYLHPVRWLALVGLLNWGGNVLAYPPNYWPVPYYNTEFGNIVLRASIDWFKGVESRMLSISYRCTRLRHDCFEGLVQVYRPKQSSDFYIYSSGFARFAIAQDSNNIDGLSFDNQKLKTKLPLTIIIPVGGNFVNATFLSVSSGYDDAALRSDITSLYLCDPTKPVTTVGGCTRDVRSPPEIRGGRDHSVMVEKVTTITLYGDDDNATDTLTWRIKSNASYGRATVSETPTGKQQTITYTPNSDYSSWDEFVVELSDGTYSDAATVTVRGFLKDDAPTIEEPVTKEPAPTKAPD